MNSINDDDWSAIERVLAGEASPDDEVQVSRWLEADPAGAELMRALREAPEAVHAARARYDSRAAWVDVQSRVHQAETTHAAQRDIIARFRRRRRLSPFVRSAASVALVIAGTIAVIRTSQLLRRDAPLIAGDVSTAAGQRATVRLAEGSTVILGPGSRIAEAAATGAERSVALTGTAYFDVVRDETRPFVVVTGGVETRVLGTTFGIRAYGNDVPLTVVVESGRVSVRSSAGIPVVLDPGQLAVVERDGSLSVRSDVDVARHLRWRTGSIAFDGASLREVAAEIRRWYGVVVDIPDSVIAEYPLTATFDGASIEDVLAVTSRSLGIQYSFDGKTVVFRP